jgi:protein-S-isoprenylcysteine O-methyltransferase Ste14
LDTLRLALFLGLVVHKLVWEILKRNGPAETAASPEVLSWRKQLLKGLKALILFCLILQTLFLDLLPIMDDSATLRVIGAIIYVIGLMIALAGRIQLGANWSNIEEARVKTSHSLISSGIYQYIRHPIYVGDLLLVAGLELALNSWLVLGSLVLFVYIFRRASAEELQLADAIPGYASYQARTKRFIPFVL